MTRWTRFALPGLCATFLLVLAVQWSLPAEDVISGSGIRLATPRSGGAEHEPSVDHWADTALARPLFSPGRRPDADSQGTSPLARLSAIIVSGGRRSAIFSAEGQKPRVVQEGGDIDGYKLLNITGDAVELRGSSGTLTLHPQFYVPAAPQPATKAPLPPSAVDYDNES